MKTSIFKHLFLSLTFLLSSFVVFSQNDKILSGIDNTEQYNTIDVIFMDKDLSIFANLLTLSGMDTQLAFTDESLTLLAPTNEAFKDMTVEKFAELTNPNNRAKLTAFVNRHFLNGEVMSSQLKNNDIIDLEGGDQIEITKTGRSVSIGGANVSNADVKTANGIIHILNGAVSVK